MNRLVAMLAVAAMLTACSSGSSAGGGSSRASAGAISAPNATPTLPTVSTPTPTQSAHEPPPYNLAANWKLIKADLKKNFAGQCLLAFSCRGRDDFSGATIYASAVGATSKYTLIKFKVDVDNAQLKTGANLILSKYAGFFSTANASQLDFSSFVSDGFDAMAVGGSAHKLMGGLIPLRLARPDPKEWIFTVGAA
jgi:hypothetical protein